MTCDYFIYEYKYRIQFGLCWCLYAREDKTVEKMKNLFEEGSGFKIKFLKKRRVYIDIPPYEFEQEQFETLIKGKEKGDLTSEKKEQ